MNEKEIEKESRETYSYSMKPSSDAMLTRMAEKLNQPKSRIVESLIMEKYDNVFQDESLFPKV